MRESLSVINVLCTAPIKSSTPKEPTSFLLLIQIFTSDMDTSNYSIQCELSNLIFTKSGLTVFTSHWTDSFFMQILHLLICLFFSFFF